MEALTGTTIGGYKLERPIGYGTTGQTFAAVDSIGSSAAIKVLHPGLSLFTRVQAFWDEQQKVAELSHPHIVVAGGADWSISGRFYLAMDLVEGIDLHTALMSHSKLSPAQVLLFAGQACLALEAVHEIGLFHGAIKPHNILLLHRGEDPTRFSTRVTDFATSNLVNTSQAPSEPMGSPGVPDAAYLAPEQFKGEGGPAADVYSLAVVMFEALTGRRPFVGSSFEELADLHSKSEPTISGVPEGLKPILAQGLAKQPGRRFPSIATMLAALEGWASEGPPELNDEPRTLFPKEEEGNGVASDGADQTVRVPMEEISAVFQENDDVAFVDEDGWDPTQEKEPSTVEEKPRPEPAKQDKKEPPVEESTKVPRDEELAAIAEKAGAVLRKDREDPTEQDVEPPPEPAKPAEVEGYLDEDGDLVELPLERSVRAFVANISPTVPPAQASGGGGNGESLDGALDAFVQDAREWNSALPPPVVDDNALAELAKVPVEKPEPPPPAPEPRAEPILAPAPPPQKPRSVALPVILAMVVGGALVFGGMRFLGTKTTPPTPDTPPDTPTEPAIVAPTEPAPGADADAGTTAAPVATPLADGGTAVTAVVDAAAGDAAAVSAATPDAAPTVAAKTPKKAIRRRRRRPRRRRRRPRRAKTTTKKPTTKAKKPTKKPKTKGDWVDPFSQ